MPVPTPDAEVERLAARAAGGEILDLEEATALCGGDVLVLGGLAEEVRRRIHGDRAHLVTVHDVAWDADPGTAERPDEIRVRGPMPEGATAADVRGTMDRLARAFPGVALRALKPCEVLALAKSSGLTTRILLGRLADAGLATLGFPDLGDDAAATREGLLAAHGAGLMTYAPLNYPPRCAPSTLARTILDLVTLPAAADRFRAAIPLPASMPEESPLTGTTGIEDLRAFACARILFPPAVRVTAEIDAVGSKLAGVALSFGADTLAGAAAQPTARLTAKDGEKPRPFNADRARRLIAECGRTAVPPPPFPAREA